MLALGAHIVFYVHAKDAGWLGVFVLTPLKGRASTPSVNNPLHSVIQAAILLPPNLAAKRRPVEPMGK